MMHDELGLEAVSDDEDDDPAARDVSPGRDMSPSINVQVMRRRWVPGAAPQAPVSGPGDGPMSPTTTTVVSVASLRARLS